MPVTFVIYQGTTKTNEMMEHAAGKHPVCHRLEEQ